MVSIARQQKTANYQSVTDYEEVMIMSDNDKQPLNSSPETNNNPAPPPVAVPPPVPPTPPPAAAPPPPTPPPRCPLMPQQPMPRKSRFGKAGCLLWLIVLVFIATLVTQVTMGLIGIAASVVKKMDLSSGSSLAKAAPKIVTEGIRPGDSSEIIGQLLSHRQCPPHLL
jgi:hypothetical protein